MTPISSCSFSFYLLECFCLENCPQTPSSPETPIALQYNPALGRIYNWLRSGSQIKASPGLDILQTVKFRSRLQLYEQLNVCVPRLQHSEHLEVCVLRLLLLQAVSLGEMRYVPREELHRPRRPRSSVLLLQRGVVLDARALQSGLRRFCKFFGEEEESRRTLRF